LHPTIMGVERRIAARRTGVALAQEQYKPQWGVNASYGYRDDAPDGMNRDDFFSLGVTFDVPLFSGRRQDKGVESAVASAEAVKTEKLLVLRSMKAAVDTWRARLLHLNQRRALYQDRLLGQMHEQAEAALNVYTHDDGDFSEVVRARIAELNAKIDALDIEVNRAKALVQLNYLFVGDEAAARTLAQGGSQ
jgi:outer membrane protein TolC